MKNTIEEIKTVLHELERTGGFVTSPDRCPSVSVAEYAYPKDCGVCRIDISWEWEYKCSYNGFGWYPRMRTILKCDKNEVESTLLSFLENIQSALRTIEKIRSAIHQELYCSVDVLLFNSNWDDFDMPHFSFSVRVPKHLWGATEHILEGITSSAYVLKIDS